jgi:hypothetical protein
MLTHVPRRAVAGLSAQAWCGAFECDGWKEKTAGTVGYYTVELLTSGLDVGTMVAER